MNLPSTREDKNSPDWKFFAQRMVALHLAHHCDKKTKTCQSEECMALVKAISQASMYGMGH